MERKDRGKHLVIKDGTRFDSVLRESVRVRGLPFAIGGIATKDGTVYEGCGRNESICPAVGMDTIVWLASMTKAVTTVALLQLTEQGALSLTQPAESILPELAGIKVLKGYDGEGNAVLAPCTRAVTVKQLLNHTSGFGYSFWNGLLDRYYTENDLPPTTSGSRKSLLAPLVREPGTAWEYGISTDWAGLILERLTGMSLGEYLKLKVLDPLNMKDTGFTIKDYSRLAPFFELDTQNHLRKIPYVFPQDAEFCSGGAGLYGTMRDYLRLSRMLLNGGSLDGAVILRPRTVKKMFSNSIGELNVMPLKGVGPSLDLNFDDGSIYKWGLCFMINEDRLQSGRNPGSQFWGGAANTYLWIDPQAGLTGVFATQVLPFLNQACKRSFFEFEAAAYAAH